MRTGAPPLGRGGGIAKPPMDPKPGRAHNGAARRADVRREASPLGVILRDSSSSAPTGLQKHWGRLWVAGSVPFDKLHLD